MYLAKTDRYDTMQYRKCGNSGLVLPAVSLGLWQNFGYTGVYSNMLDMIKTAFDCGITHFDAANNYGAPHGGSAEENFGRILKNELGGYRDELIISSKAGYTMWDGPYGVGSSKKYLMASLDQSLERLGLDYVDIFYSHRFDPNTPLEETMMALDRMVRNGKALYVGISNYDAENSAKAIAILNELGTPLFINQPRYSMLDRTAEQGLWDVLKTSGVGSIVYSPLAQGVLSDKYLNGVPQNSRAKVSPNSNISEGKITPELVGKVVALNAIAKGRGQTLAQMALSWALRDGVVTSVLIGASSPEQIVENVGILANLKFTSDELAKIDGIVGASAK